MKTGIKSLIVLSILAALIAMISSSVLAAKPNNQACVGKDFSGYARYGSTEGLLTFQSGSGFGGTISTLANNGPGGFGTELQNHMAGNVPDFVIPNSCND